MDKEYKILMGELIGLARATDGSEHLINPSATALIIRCLTVEGEWSSLLNLVQEEKRKMVPGCFSCSNPCGRTSPCDLLQWDDGELGLLRYGLLEALHQLARQNPRAEEGLFYRGLIAAGMADYDREDLLPILQEIHRTAEIAPGSRTFIMV